MKINGQPINSLSVDSSVPGEDRNTRKVFQISPDSDYNLVFGRIYDYLLREFNYSMEMHKIII